MREKAHENRLRRMAERQGLALRKSRRRDPEAVDYDSFTLIDPAANLLVAGGQWGMDFGAVEAWLTDGAGS